MTLLRNKSQMIAVKTLSPNYSKENLHLRNASWEDYALPSMLILHMGALKKILTNNDALRILWSSNGWSRNELFILVREYQSHYFTPMLISRRVTVQGKCPTSRMFAEDCVLEDEYFHHNLLGSGSEMMK